MFPGYLFVRCMRSATCIASGARPVFVDSWRSEAAPARLDAAVVEFLRSREDGDGIISAEPLALGSEVVITDGPLRGFIAVVERRLDARQRVLLLLDILQRQTRVELPERWIRQA